MDNLVVASDVDQFQNSFLTRFPDSSAHSPDLLLGMDIFVKDNKCHLSQMALINKGLKILHLQNCRSVLTPLTPHVQLTPATQDDAETFKQLNINYRQFTGMLNYLS